VKPRWEPPPNRPYETRGGPPVFRTQRLLGNRALVSDGFFRFGSWINENKPGMGEQMHKDGYNVLYGDWHAKWYGDPQGTVKWTVPIFGNMQEYIYAPAHASAREAASIGLGNFVSAGVAAAGVPDHVFWNMFDQSEGVDVGDEFYAPAIP